ncbi:MAG: cytochrome c family protein [Brevundimonas sp.]
MRTVRVLFIAASAAALAACGSPDEPGRKEASAPSSPTPEPRVLTDEERVVILASLPAPYSEADTENGRRVFARCRSCHTLPQGGPNMTGPNLWGVFGRQAGSLEGYNYSPALREADFTWTAERLDQWLNDPRGFLPGNKMAFAGVRDETDRRDLIAWLKLETGYAPE